MDPRKSQLKYRLLAVLSEAVFNLLLDLIDDFLDTTRMNPAVGHQTLQSLAANFSPDRIEARNNDRFWGIIDDEVPSRSHFQSPDVPAFPADDPPLHLIIGQVHNRNAGLGDMIGRVTLHGQAEYFAGFAAGQLPGFFLDPFHFVRCLD